MFTEPVNSFHAEHMLQHLLSRVKELCFELIAEIQWFRKYPEEFRLLEAHRQPFFNDKFVQNLVDILLRHFWVSLEDRVIQDFDERADGDGDLANGKVKDVADLD